MCMHAELKKDSEPILCEHQFHLISWKLKQNAQFMTVLFFAFLATPLCRSFDGNWLFFFAEYLFICRLPFIKTEIIAIFKYCIHNTWQILAISIILTASNLGNCKNRSISKGVWRRDNEQRFSSISRLVPLSNLCIACCAKPIADYYVQEFNVHYYSIVWTVCIAGYTTHVHRAHMPNEHTTQNGNYKRTNKFLLSARNKIKFQMAMKCWVHLCAHFSLNN